MSTKTTDTPVTCYGSVTGWCGTRHRSEDAAEKCRARHHRDCRSAGGYSDREIHPVAEMAQRVDGSLYR